MIRYDFTKHAEKDFLHLPKNIQKRIIEKLGFYLNSDNPLAFARRMAGMPHPVYRFRIDDYRVVFDWKGNSILILKIGHRSEIYR